MLVLVADDCGDREKLGESVLGGVGGKLSDEADRAGATTSTTLEPQRHARNISQ